jgi:sugar (pentulose or hexulose) kinase
LANFLAQDSSKSIIINNNQPKQGLEGAIEMGTIVLDVGKTLAKLSLWTEGEKLIERRTRQNAIVNAGGYRALDVLGIEEWMAGVLYEFARMAAVERIIPIAHGSAAAIVRDGALVCAPMDYEEPVLAAERRRYDLERDGFAMTGSPPLPGGLNLGVQLHRLEQLHPDLLKSGTTILPWPQYWSWVLAGVAASEVTSLGCHSDLWRPIDGTPSGLSVARGWANRFAPLRRADEVLGTLSPAWAARTGLSSGVRIHCGLHDSNAALLAARACPEIADNESTVLSTGTWFVAMRTPVAGAPVDIAALPEGRDCFVNVDAFGQPIPSARFMGGREIEMLSAIDTPRVDIAPGLSELLGAVPAVLRSGVSILPTMTPGCGPFPHSHGRWTGIPRDPFERQAAICLYAALVADVSLNLIGAKERILIEGRFAEAQVFVRALASLRSGAKIYVSSAHNDASCGALRLIDPDLAPPSALFEVLPLDQDLAGYRDRWLKEANRAEAAA